MQADHSGLTQCRRIYKQARVRAHTRTHNCTRTRTQSGLAYARMPIQVRELGRKQTIPAYEKARDLLVAADKRERAMKETLRKAISFTFACVYVCFYVSMYR